MNKLADLKNKRFFSLNLKMAIVVLMALVSALLVYVALEAVEDLIANHVYLSEDSVRRNVNEAYDDLLSFIEEKKIKSTDTEQLQSWLKEHDYTYLTISDNYTISFEGGWQVFSANSHNGGTNVSEGQNTLNYDDPAVPRITPDTFKQDIRNRIIKFQDGQQYVYINVYREQTLYQIMFYIKIVLGVLVIVGILLIYNARVLKRVSTLSSRVETITAGDIGAPIGPTANDEIGKLATNVNVMRNSIVDRLQKEKKAWDANTQLITAMSHDIRTPLTSLIGYLDIIEGGKAQSREEELRYIESCREKAFQLKDLSDKLFQYFLVFGSDAKEKKLDVYDAGILLHQLISEHSAELINYGFKIDLDYAVPEVEIEADISSLRRLFDNVASNIIKYADKNFPVTITAKRVDDKILIVLANQVLTTSRKVESNKIGLKTCERICQEMNGNFEYKDEENIFTVEITLAVKGEIEREPAPEDGQEKTERMQVTTDTLMGIDLSEIDLEDVMQLDK